MAHMPPYVPPEPPTPYLNASGVTVSRGQVVYLSSAGQFSLASSSSLATATILGIVADTSIAPGATGNIQTAGAFTTTGLTAGAAYFLGLNGSFTATMPTSPNAIVTQIGSALDSSTLELNIQAPIQLNGPKLVLILGQSNATGHGDTAFVDAALALLTAYGVPMDEQFSFNITNPVVWTNTGTEALQPYAPNGQLNMGCELTLGRSLDAGGVFPFISKTSLDSSTLMDHWIPTSTSPLNNGVNLYHQALARIRAHILASQRPLGAIVWIQGEFDALDSTHANAYQANLGIFTAQLRADLGSNWWFVFNELNVNLPIGSAPDRDVVRAAQVAYAASDPLSVLINVDDLPLDLDNNEGVGVFHYKANALVSMGNRFGAAVVSKLNPSALTPSAPVANTPWLLGYDQALLDFHGAGSLSPRWGGTLEYQAGDVGILVALGWFAAGTISLSAPAGFTQIGSQVVSVFSGLDLVLATYWCRATSNAMPAPTVSFPGTANMAAIFVVRGCIATGNPVDVFSSGANNANAPAISIPGATTTHANELILVPLAIETGAVVLPTHCYNTRDSWVFDVSPALDTSSGDVSTITQAMADRFARGIAAHPEDWHMMQPQWLADLSEERQAKLRGDS